MLAAGVQTSMGSKPKHLLPVAIALLATLAAATAQQSLRNRLFAEPGAARADIQGALATARHQHKRVLLEFGGDWCGDCQVLNLYFHQPENLKLLNAHYVLVDVNVGEDGIDQNLELGTKYGINLKKGVPALAVLTANGKVVFAQRNGGFDQQIRVDPASVHDFLERWK